MKKRILSLLLAVSIACSMPVSYTHLDVYKRQVYSEIKPTPTIANVQDGVAAFKAAEADCIVTIGGGSSIDVYKRQS